MAGDGRKREDPFQRLVLWRALADRACASQGGGLLPLAARAIPVHPELLDPVVILGPQLELNDFIFQDGNHALHAAALHPRRLVLQHRGLQEIRRGCAQAVAVAPGKRAAVAEDADVQIRHDKLVGLHHGALLAAVARQRGALQGTTHRAGQLQSAPGEKVRPAAFDATDLRSPPQIGRQGDGGLQTHQLRTEPRHDAHLLDQIPPADGQRSLARQPGELEPDLAVLHALRDGRLPSDAASGLVRAPPRARRQRTADRKRLTMRHDQQIRQRLHAYKRIALDLGKRLPPAHQRIPAGLGKEEAGDQHQQRQRAERDRDASRPAGGHRAPKVVARRFFRHLPDRRATEGRRHGRRQSCAIGQFHRPQQAVAQVAILFLDQPGQLPGVAPAPPPVMQPDPTTRRTHHAAKEGQRHPFPDRRLPQAVRKKEDPVRQQQAAQRTTPRYQRLHAQQALLKGPQLTSQRFRQRHALFCSFLRHRSSLVAEPATTPL